MKNLLQRLDPEVKTKLDLVILEHPDTAQIITDSLTATDNVYKLSFGTMSYMQMFLGIDLDSFYYIFDYND